MAGVDCNRVQVERARRLVLSAAFLNTDATRLDSCLGSFGAVVCAYVLINPAPRGGCRQCVAEQATTPVRNREARVTEPHVA